MYHRNRCLDEMTETLQRTLRDSVHAGSSPANRHQAWERAEWLGQVALALTAGLSALALLARFWG